MIKIFGSTDTNFNSNGDVVIKATRAVVHKEDNGDFYLEIEAPIDYVEFFLANNIIVADTPQGAQAFRLGTDIQTTRTKVKAKAKHVYYDGLNYLIADSYVVQKDCEDALLHLNAATDNTSPFSVFSDVETIDSYRCVRTSLTEAVNVVLERWGGHLVRDNFSFGIRQSIGQDLGVTIQYRKNLKNITKTENWTGVCTKLLPVGKDGVLLDDLYLYSQTQYDIPFTKTVAFTQDINRDDYETEAQYIAALKYDLEAQGTAYLAASQYPAINYTVSANPEKITDVGDVVAVYDEPLGIELVATVLSFDYDVILGQYIQVQFGTANPSLSELMSSINSSVEKSIKTSSDTLTDYVNTEINQTKTELENYVNSKVPVITANVVAQIDPYLNFKAGDSLTVTNELAAGYLSHNQRVVYFQFPLGKNASGLNVSVTELKINGLSIIGSLFGNWAQNGHDMISDTAFTVTASAKESSIVVVISKNAAMSADADTPVNIDIKKMTLTFS